MDDSVREKLTECGLEEYIPKFKEFKLNANFICLQEEDFREFIHQVWSKLTSSATGGAMGGGKRKADPSESGADPKKRQKRIEDERKLKGVKEIMSCVNKKLCGDDQIITLLRDLIQNLKTDKKELVGVFGRTGAGKSSLINAIIGEENLLPTGVGRACTSLIIKVEGSTDNQNYEATVEFISEEELVSLVQSTKHLFGNKETDDESKESNEKMMALFGDDWNTATYEAFMESKTYQEISNAIKQPNTKHMSYISSRLLLKELTKYTQNIKNRSGPSYWPVVKCVTIKVPNSAPLRHVTLVDLPGTGDRNKTRNDMWKEMVSSCGTVWIVAEMKRCISDREPWDILQRTCSLLGNGGECRNIHFICNQADLCLNKLSAEDAKPEVIQEFQKLPEVQDHFPMDCFKVFVVSATDENMPGNEIFALDDFLLSVNDPEELLQRYASDAFGILALMKGARSTNTDQKQSVFSSLCAVRRTQSKEIKKQMNDAYASFEQTLTAGVNKAKHQWERALNDEIGSEKSYKKLRSIVKHEGVQQTSTGGHIDVNQTLASVLTRTFDRQFLRMFPNARKDGPFYGAVREFSLEPERLIKNYKDLALHLKFLKREEEKLKEKLCKHICDCKKQIYNTVAETVKTEMLTAYKEAKKIRGDRAVESIKRTLKDHVQKNDMYNKAKGEMLKQLNKLMCHINNSIVTGLDEVMVMSLEKDMSCVPDVTEEFEKMKKICDELGVTAFGPRSAAS